MKCPYCAEDVRDEAVVCRFCQRDIALFRPIFSRFSSIDQAISELHSAIDIRPERTATNAIEKALIATASSIALATITCWLTWNYPFWPDLFTRIFDEPLNFLSVASPFFAALWMGWSLPRLRVIAYLLLGALPGFMGFVAWFLLHAHNVSPYPDNWKSNLFAYVASGPLRLHMVARREPYLDERFEYDWIVFQASVHYLDDQNKKRIMQDDKTTV